MEDDTFTDVNSNQQDKGEKAATPVMQQPGEVIAPEVVDGIVEKIANELYGLTVTKCRQLNGYDDKNYRVIASPRTSNPNILVVCPDGYVIKVVNTMDTNRPEILYAQIEMIKHLHSHGITVQDPVPAKDGQLITFYNLPVPGKPGETKRHAICVRTFIQGKILYDVTLTPDLCYKVGEFVGKMTKAFSDFHHPFYDTFDCLWSMNNIPKVSEFVDVLTDQKDRRVVEEVIKEFTDTVLPKRHEIRSGFIHGDPNEQNILVLRKGGDSDPSSDDANDNPTEDEYEVAGILDFQDGANTHPLYDLAMNIAYVSLQAVKFDPVDVGGHILAGYATQIDLPAVERDLLRVAVAGRLVQSLVLGAYSHSLDPTNSYVLTTAARGWHLLHALWDTPREALYRRWDDIEKLYKR